MNYTQTLSILWKSIMNHTQILSIIEFISHLEKNAE